MKLSDVLKGDENTRQNALLLEFGIQIHNEIDQNNVDEIILQSGDDGVFSLQKDGIYVYYTDAINFLQSSGASIVIPYTRTDLVDDLFAIKENEGSSKTESTSTTENLIDNMNTNDLKKLCEFFDSFCMFMPLNSIGTDIDVVRFGVCPYLEGDYEFNIPKEKVEEEVFQYFGVEKINHEAVGDNDIDVPSYRNGYYFSGDRGGWEETTWCTVSKFTDNGNGTYTAVVILYGTFGDMPDNWYEPEEKWSQSPGVEIINESVDYDDVNITRQSTDTVVLKPYIYNGEKTWQIASINGWVIPKVLLE